MYHKISLGTTEFHIRLTPHVYEILRPYVYKKSAWAQTRFLRFSQQTVMPKDKTNFIKMWEIVNKKSAFFMGIQSPFDINFEFSAL